MTTRIESSRNTETQEVVAILSVTDAEPRPIYKGGKRMWRPERIRARWNRDRVNDGPWSDWSLYASVTGPYVKGNGEPYSGAFQDNTERIYEADEEFGTDLRATRPNGELPGYFRREDDAVDLDV